MVSRAERRKTKNDFGDREVRRPQLLKTLTQTKALVRDLGQTLEKIGQRQSSAEASEGLHDAIDQVQTVIRGALGTLGAAESVVKNQLAAIPEPDAEGYYPAAETLQAILAHQIAARRQEAGLSQGELAQRAGVRQETVSRLESGKHAPTVRTVEKIDRALSAAGV